MKNQFFLLKWSTLMAKAFVLSLFVGSRLFVGFYCDAPACLMSCFVVIICFYLKVKLLAHL